VDIIEGLLLMMMIMIMMGTVCQEVSSRSLDVTTGMDSSVPVCVGVWVWGVQDRNGDAVRDVCRIPHAAAVDDGVDVVMLSFSHRGQASPRPICKKLVCVQKPCVQQKSMTHQGTAQSACRPLLPWCVQSWWCGQQELLQAAPKTCIGDRQVGNPDIRRSTANQHHLAVRISHIPVVHAG
jgi:hypothetical protein